MPGCQTPRYDVRTGPDPELAIVPENRPEYDTDCPPKGKNSSDGTNLGHYAVGVSLMTVQGILRLMRFISDVRTRPGPIS